MAYKKILVAVDGSDISTLAMQEAIKLAKDLHAKIRVIYVADELITVGDGVSFDYERFEIAVRGFGQSILQNMESLAKLSGVTVESCIVDNADHSARIPERIVQDASEWHADLLVVGTHGRRGFSHFLLGSVAEGVMRIATIPVLLIRGKI